MNALAKQVGGNHYKAQKYQVVEFLQDINCNTAIGYAIKYVARYPNKKSYDLEKAIHCLELYQDWLQKNLHQIYETNSNIDYQAVVKFTHQFEPSKTMALQKILELMDNPVIYNTKTDKLELKENFNHNLETTINAINMLNIGDY